MRVDDAHQVDDVAVAEVRLRVERDQRVLVTTLTKRMAEDLTEYYSELGVRVRYLHSDIDTLERVEILRDLRRGEFDVLVGINLLREGLDLPALLASRDLSRKERAIVTQSARLIGAVAHKLLVTVTSPLNLLRELFTVKGAGTMLRRGAVVARHEGYEGVDTSRLRALIASSFGRAPTEAFFDRPVLRVYLEEAYRGCAIVIDSPFGPYLTKFATDREARGEGIARDLWDVFREEHRVVFWRARANNPINAVSYTHLTLPTSDLV